MKHIKKNFKILFLIFAIVAIFIIPSAYAHCPLCTAAVGAAAISAKYYGMDSSIIGMLIGAFGISTGLWIGLKIKKQYFKFQLPIIILLSYILTVIPLSGIDNDKLYLPILLFGSSGTFLNKVYWPNKILFGSIIGAVLSLAAYLSHNKIKKIRKKVLFPYQGIAITLLFLAFGGMILFLLSK